LKKAHRVRLTRPGVRFVFLKGDPALIRARIRRRKGHFFDPALLDSQLETLEEPDDALVVDVGATPQEIAATIRAAALGPRAESRKPKAD
jgi:gluconokinase